MRVQPIPAIAIIVGTLCLAGCQSLLPAGRIEVTTIWETYDEAVAAFERIEPYKSTRADLHAAGLDPRSNPNIAILNSTDVMQRFGASALLKAEEMDRGVRDCLLASRRCTGYAINMRRVRKQRVGNFWLDTFNFRRQTSSSGWSVNALIVFVDDTVVYETVGGQPAISEFESVSNPLGPLQGLGESLRPSIR